MQDVPGVPIPSVRVAVPFPEERGTGRRPEALVARDVRTRRTGRVPAGRP